MYPEWGENQHAILQRNEKTYKYISVPRTSIRRQFLNIQARQQQQKQQQQKEKKNLIQIITAAPPVFRILRISNNPFYGVGVRGEHNLPQTAG